MAARICPHCKRRVDERVSKGLAVCLACGKPLDAPPQGSYGPMSSPVPGPVSMPGSMQGPMSGPVSGYAQGYGRPSYGGPPSYGSAPPAFGPPAQFPSGAYPQPVLAQKKSGSGVLIAVIVVATLAILGGLATAVLLLRSPSSSSSGTTTDPTSTLVVETPEGTATADDTADTKHTTPTAHPKPVPTPTIVVPPHPTTTSTSGPNAPFPIELAFAKMDQATSDAEKSCPTASGPFGATVVDVTFENDGRVGTLSRKPIGGTPEGLCITSKFLAIKVGAFQGSARTFSRTVTMRAPAGASTTTATSTATAAPSGSARHGSGF